MTVSWWMWLAGGAIIGGMRWAFADFLLDRFGSRRFGWNPSGPSARGTDRNKVVGGGDERPHVRQVDEVAIWVADGRLTDGAGGKP
jgi:hypothetical protein